MVVEDSSNKHKREERQNNGKDYNIDDHSEGREKGSNNKEKGGGRGRGRYGEEEEADSPYQFKMTKEEEEETIVRKQKGVI